MKYQVVVRGMEYREPMAFAAALAEAEIMRHSWFGHRLGTYDVWVRAMEAR